MTKHPKHWWEYCGMNSGMVAIMCSLNFLFGTGIRMVRVLDGNSWIYPTLVGPLKGHPTKIPPEQALGGVV